MPIGCKFYFGFPMVLICFRRFQLDFVERERERERERETERERERERKREREGSN